MPCVTVIRILVKDRAIALATMKHFGINENNLSQMGEGYFVDLSGTGVTKAKFKTEYGLRVAEAQAKKEYGYKARTHRGIVEQKGKRYQTLFITTS